MGCALESPPFTAPLLADPVRPDGRWEALVSGVPHSGVVEGVLGRRSNLAPGPGCAGQVRLAAGAPALTLPPTRRAPSPAVWSWPRGKSQETAVTNADSRPPRPEEAGPSGRAWPCACLTGFPLPRCSWTGSREVAWPSRSHAERSVTRQRAPSPQEASVPPAPPLFGHWLCGFLACFFEVHLSSVVRHHICLGMLLKFKHRDA